MVKTFSKMKLLHLFLVGHFLFVSCAIDSLHTDDCPTDNGSPYASDEGCPACLFKQGANSEQPTFVFVPDFDLGFEQRIIEIVQQVKSNEPYSFYFLRAPPA
jgi:hypothetical protein